MTDEMEKVDDRIEYVGDKIDEWMLVKAELREFKAAIETADVTGDAEIANIDVQTITTSKVVTVDAKFRCDSFETVEELVDAVNWGGINVNDTPHLDDYEYLLTAGYRAGDSR